MKIRKESDMFQEPLSVVKKTYNQKFCWGIFSVLLVGHVGMIIGTYFLLTGSVKVLTYLWVFLMFLFGLTGITTSAHRLFSHRTYKVTYGLKIFLLFCQQLAGVLSMFFWCRIHRTHHKFTDTDKDPTNINRGLFYAYIQWLWLTHTPEVQEELDRIDMKDLLSDKALQFQDKHYVMLFIFITLLFPTIVPVVFWNESFLLAFFVNLTRMMLNVTQQNIANSFLHYGGEKPYDKRIKAAEKTGLKFFLGGESAHSFHHSFPYDYRASEFGGITDGNLATFVIDTCAKFGWAYDRKFATPEVIERRVRKYGDGSHWLMKKEALKEGIWGFGDENIATADKKDLK